MAPAKKTLPSPLGAPRPFDATRPGGSAPVSTYALRCWLGAHITRNIASRLASVRRDGGPVCDRYKPLSASGGVLDATQSGYTDGTEVLQVRRSRHHVRHEHALPALSCALLKHRRVAVGEDIDFSSTLRCPTTMPARHRSSRWCNITDAVESSTQDCKLPTIELTNPTPPPPASTNKQIGLAGGPRGACAPSSKCNKRCA